MGTGGRLPERAPSGTWVRRPTDAGALVIGLAVTAAGMVAVRDGSVSGLEEDVFRAVNDLPGALYPLIWPVQQLGVLVIGPVVAIVAAAMRRFRLAGAAVVATILKLGLERVVKALVTRERPGTSLSGDIEARGHVPLTGESFTSGHVMLAVAIAGVVAPYLPGRWRALPWVLAGLVGFGRVYVGAHLPLDVVCGAALGLAIAGGVNLMFGVRAAPR